VAKRLFDVTVSGIALLVLFPLLLAIAVLVKLTSPGPVLFCQARLGRGARPFEIYKFRTMVVGADTLGSRITLNGDARVTRLGRKLRRFDLDELPTLFNVLRGDMSIVGPRPELPEYLPYYSDEQRRVFSVRPGLTDPGTLAFRDEARQLEGKDAEQVYLREILPQKLALNLEYIRERNLLYDVALIARTLSLVLSQSKGMGGPRC
jgi:lipopolysaccharide/colanic/teichoic acid biosynthesis glycosyltransferase